MSTLPRRVGDDELDGLLRSMLRDGPEPPSRRIADGAMAQVASTPQARHAIVVPWAGGARLLSPVGAFAAVAIALAITIGVLGLLQLPGPAAPSPAPTPSSSPDPLAGLVLVGSVDDGFFVRAPASWPNLVQTAYERLWTWQGPDGALTVSYGTSIFDGGTITLCGPPSPERPVCQEDHYTYSIPYDPATDGIGPLDIEGYVRDRCVGGCEVTVETTTLGGEPAQLVRTVAANLRVTYVATFHERRPVVLYWSEPVSAPERPDRLELVLGSFTFLELPAGPSPTALVDPTELVSFRNQPLGYSILVPRFWGLGIDEAGDASVHEFGAGRGAGTRDDPALTISVGAADGTLTLCQGRGHVCSTVVATTLEELESLLVSVPPDFDSPSTGEVSGALELGGLPGGFKRPEYQVDRSSSHPFGLGGTIQGTCLGCPGMLYHAFTISDGRPVVISVDWWTIAFGTLPTNYVSEILGSFRLRP